MKGDEVKVPLDKIPILMPQGTLQANVIKGCEGFEQDGDILLDLVIGQTITILSQGMNSNTLKWHEFLKSLKMLYFIF